MANAESIKHLEHSIESMEDHFTVRKGTIISLLDDEGDWSFTIKMNAVCESLVSYKISKYGKQSEDVPTKLANHKFVPYSEQLNYLEQKNRIDSFQKDFMAALGHFRNDLAHSIERISYSFVDKCLDRDGRDHVTTLGCKFASLKSHIDYGDLATGLFKFSLDRINSMPRSIIWSGAVLPIMWTWRCVFISTAHLSLHAHDPTFTKQE